MRVKAAVRSSPRPVTLNRAIPSGRARRVQARCRSAAAVRCWAPWGSARRASRLSRAVSWAGVSWPASLPGWRSARSGTLPGSSASASTAAAWSGARWRTPSVMRRARTRSTSPARRAVKVAGRRSTSSNASSSRSRARTGDSHSAVDTSWAVHRSTRSRSTRRRPVGSWAWASARASVRRSWASSAMERSSTASAAARTRAAVRRDSTAAAARSAARSLGGSPISS